MQMIIASCMEGMKFDQCNVEKLSSTQSARGVFPKNLKIPKEENKAALDKPENALDNSNVDNFYRIFLKN